jgi:hypothetical protein
MTATIWRTCPSCGASFQQPDDPGRKRVYCSRACQQAAYRAANAPAPVSAPAAGTSAPAATSSATTAPGPSGPAPASATTGAKASAAGSASSADLARIRRIIAALLRKAAATSFPHEAAACREKAEALRAKYGL